MKSFVIFSTLIAGSLAGFAGYTYQPQSYAVASQLVDGGSALNGYNYPQPIDQTQLLQAVPETYNKEFYSFGAPDEDFEDAQAAQKIAAAVQRNLRVVFIRTPENRALEHAALSLAKQTLSDKTAIFVLNKQHDIGDLANKLSVVRDQHTHKPEVHFVKYRTPEEALHAQREIQAQFDSLQGTTTRNTDEGVAPVLNFATPSLYKPQPQPQALYGTPSYGSSGAVDIGLGSTANFGGVSNFAAGIDQGYGAYYGNAYSANLAGGNVAAAGESTNSASVAGQVNNVQSLVENTVSSANGRLASSSGFAFPGEAAPSNTYLPPLRAKRAKH